MPSMRSSVILGILATFFLGSVFSAQTSSQPVSYVRRAEAAFLLLKHSGRSVDLTQKTSEEYTDIESGAWYVPWILAAIDQGVLDVDHEAHLAYPHRSVTRKEFLEMMANTFHLEADLPHGYTDVLRNTSANTYAGIAWKYALFPTDPPLLHPEYRMTHTEATSVLYALPESAMVQQEHGIRSSSAASVHEVQGKEFVAISYAKTVYEFMLQKVRNQSSYADHLRMQMLEAINTERQKYRLKPLTMNSALQSSAQRYAENMYKRGYFSHFSPEGTQYIERIRASGYLSSPFCSCHENSSDCSCNPQYALGENLAKGQISVSQVIKEWMASPSHRSNILHSAFTEVGIGIFANIWVQHFGTVDF